MKRLFMAIRKNDLATVEGILDKKPELVNAIAKAPPKRDDGQSLLQVALKTGNFDIASYLLEKDVDVHFMESDDCTNEWRSPVLHDAINAAIMQSRWNTHSEIAGFVVYGTEEKAKHAFLLLEEIIGRGADVNSKDSYGNSGLDRACLQASQILPAYDAETGLLSKDRVVTDELRFDLSKIFDILIESGADTAYISPENGKTVLERYKNEPVAEFLPL